MERVNSCIVTLSTMKRPFKEILIVIALCLAVSLSAQAQRLQTEFDVHLVAEGLQFPWGMAFMPDGNVLVTEKVGRLRIITPDGKVSEPVKGVPAVFFQQQGGLLDVALDPEFAKNRLIYLSYAEPEGSRAGTAVARAELKDGSLENLQVIFRQVPKTEGPVHFGSRLAFAPDGNLFITLGDRGDYMEEAQNLSNHIGKIIRIRPDGSVPADNPFVNNPQAKPEIWSYGHRSVQGAAIHPKTGALWIHEHGPKGGDEINIPQAGKNYGWPKANYGVHYNGAPIKHEHAEQGFEEPIHYWVPSIAPSGMVFYTGKQFPGWRGSLFIGALAGRQVVRLTTDDKKILSEERLLTNTLRFRDVEQGPDGALYLLTDEDNGKLLKLSPK
ncbi:Glucose/arabinose dehydrogenase, beta-propeller fold [Nitrosomonas oligotropha]|uniref:Glucose/arabinose dehydrogenase, beta-propeller fold n=2 Tax=Nitrosomonas oligotropha TaxID=42354 RepID=A0A1H8Q8Y9_9PROT|nr:Glucose/arabinose dehydrogenase, beta-propeller fold [Nitrosomonas oligotropha]SEO50223.1 Glucose/arabinose dehydrogenase, beta-propeller fold [Nitrosomonas oligotropha]